MDICEGNYAIEDLIEDCGNAVDIARSIVVVNAENNLTSVRQQQFKGTSGANHCHDSNGSLVGMNVTVDRPKSPKNKKRKSE